MTQFLYLRQRLVMENNTTVFDVIKNINTIKDASKDTRENLLSVYDPFVVNKAFSLHLDTILYSNEMNINSHISKQMQYDYYMNSIRSRNRWAKWPKSTKENHDIVRYIMVEYNVSFKSAFNIYKILTGEELSEIKEKYKKDKDDV